MLDFLIHASHHINPLLLCLFVGVMLLLESSGIPILNTSLLLFAGAVASFGHVNIVVVALVAIAGSTAGACSAYLIGLRGGEPALQRLISRFRIDPRKIDKANRWFSNAGGERMIFLSRILPYVRPFACFFGGITGMPFRRFFIAALGGSIVWCCAILAVGWSLGRRWREAFYLIQTYTLPTLGVIVLAIAAYLLAKFVIKRRLNKQQAASNRAETEKQPGEDLLEV